MAGIMNYTTKVAPEKTAAEIVVLLQRKGVLQINHVFEQGCLKGFAFVIPVAGVATAFQLPVNVEGVKQHMIRQKKGILTVGQKKRIEQQALRTAWRILKDWIEAQIALIESQQAELGQVFMPYAIDAGGRTMYQLFVENNQRQLGSGVNPEVTQYA